MPSIHFTKMHGAGNDFIVIDNRSLRLQDTEAVRLTQRLCPRRTGIGADGLVLLEPGHRTEFRMRHYNTDGSRATFCGNGARCLARFAYRKGVAGASMTFEADDGMHHATIVGDDVQLHMVDPNAIMLHRPILDYTRTAVLHTINTGAPHAVILSDDVTAEDIERDGRALRRHDLFQPYGTNVNFVQQTGPGALVIRTYERGVEAETLSCGTGAVAAALTVALLDGTGAPVMVQTHGGETLVVDFQRQDEAITGVILQGSAHMVFDGELTEAS